ncbi:MAG: glutamate-5-semialdehyde dehydrogenase [Micavibrio aeruginosavorus]|uniref:Gamma-glutamyl phosphate reductase n=1 Tax=Micavibrio aeruginosavorus TaxID=349221 RepID=A0A2W5PJQ1_9BACT|nr:MAG: glutamate-5-semialdehyde dehydrogenase [Micavibrio aeruginosavorus]
MHGNHNIVQDLAIKARTAAFVLSQTDDSVIDAVLSDLETALRTQTDDILKANSLDADAALQKNLASSMIDRLTLTAERIRGMADSIADIRVLENPCGKVLEEWTRPNGLRLQKVSVPIGVLGMIYESRPNVTIDAAALALKSRNAIILRGGSESFHSSMLLHSFIVAALKKNGLPSECVCMIGSQDRSHVGDMLNAAGYIDVLIPRGGKGLTGRVMNEAKMPVFAHLDGNCHIYIHPSAKPDLALSVVKNAKLRRTGICGAAESLLLDQKLDTSLARDIVGMLLKEGVEIVGDGAAQALDKNIKPAVEEDWSAEYLDKKISIKYVKDVGDAVAHINHYGSHHTDCILAEDKSSAQYFLTNVDSAIVMHNASTQFADGGEFGFGAEIGIGTGKLHARGPVGVRQLCTFKYKVLGDGQIRP